MGIVKKLNQFRAVQLFNLLEKKNRMFDQNFFSRQLKIAQILVSLCTPALSHGLFVRLQERFRSNLMQKLYSDLQTNQQSTRGSDERSEIIFSAA